MTEWYGVADSDEQERLLAAWPDAPLINLEICDMILTTAREQVLACAPAPDPDALHVEGGIIGAGAVTPKTYVYAQLQVAKKVWQSEHVTTDSGEVGAEGFTFTPAQRERLIRDIIRPRDGKPHVL
jgi:hypothetical protein